jgi:hypothetical protein
MEQNNELEPIYLAYIYRYIARCYNIYIKLLNKNGIIEIKNAYSEFNISKTLINKLDKLLKDNCQSLII